MTSLISKLNSLVALTPDEIAAKLKNKGWRKASELGEIYFRDNMTTRHAYWKVKDGRPTQTKSTTWTFSACVGERGSYSQFISQIETSPARHNEIYWIIPTSEFTGEPPPCTT